MSNKKKILILGNGRIAEAVSFFCRKIIKCPADFIKRDSQAANCGILIGALPGELGEKGLALALKYKKDLLDISDIDPPFYLKNKKAINAAGITVIPGCGFAPGLVNAILGKELSNFKNVKSLEIKSGSLSPKEFFFPFLWCFEDLTLEHKIPSWQIINGKKCKFKPFQGYQKESFFGIKAESYYCASGFENILNKIKTHNFINRVIRPKGFYEFFSFLNNEGFLNKGNFLNTKQIVETNKIDNYTISEITISADHKNIAYLIKSYSDGKENLNSMQKITASVPAVIAKYILEDKILHKKLFFMEDLGKDQNFFDYLICGIRKEGIHISRKEIKG